MKSVMFAVLVLLGALSQRAQAGSSIICSIKTTAKVLECSIIGDDEARLQCYDDAARFFQDCLRR